MRSLKHRWLPLLAIVAGLLALTPASAQPRSGTPPGTIAHFTTLLAEELRQLGAQKAAAGERDLAAFFAQKGAAAAAGTAVLPEMPEAWRTADSRSAPLLIARERLMRLFDFGARAAEPESAAKAERHYDCWVTARRAEDIDQCHRQFDLTMIALQQWAASDRRVGIGAPQRFLAPQPPPVAGLSPGTGARPPPVTAMPLAKRQYSSPPARAERLPTAPSAAAPRPSNDKRPLLADRPPNADDSARSTLAGPKRPERFPTAPSAAAPRPPNDERPLLAVRPPNADDSARSTLAGPKKEAARPAIVTAMPPGPPRTDDTSSLVARVIGPSAVMGAGRGSALAPPVYNAVFSPLDPAAPTIVHDMRETSVEFYIGPHHAFSAVLGDDAEVRKALSDRLDSAEVKLAIVMMCPFCVDEAPQLGTIEFDRSTRASTHHTFTFTPDRGKTEQGIGELSFSVISPGGSQDHVKVYTEVLAAGSPAVLSDKRTSKSPPIFNVIEEKAVDLQIVIQPHGDGAFYASFLPGPRLEPLMHKLVFEADGNPRSFALGIINAEEASQNVQQAYAELRARIEGGPLAQLLATQATPNFELTEAQLKDVVGSLATIGGDLYYNLFSIDHCEQPDLCRVLDALNDFDAGTEPLKLVIWTRSLFIPWQLLHKPGVADIERFWGIRFSLSVVPLDPDHPEGRLPEVMQRPKGPSFLYAHYAATDHPSTADRSIMGWSSKFRVRLNADLDPEQPAEVDSAAKFLAALSDHPQDFSLIWTYGHGSSGSDLTTGSGGDLLRGVSVTGPILIFGPGPNDFVSVERLQRLVSQQANPPNPYLARSPIVVLNGCETGTRGFGAPSRYSLPGIFVNLGARAVVATEAPIWDEFGYAFSVDLLDELFHGGTIGDALTRTRRKYVEEKRNPFGLLYSLHGSPNAHIEVAAGNPG